MRIFVWEILGDVQTQPSNLLAMSSDRVAFGKILGLFLVFPN